MDQPRQESCLLQLPSMIWEYILTIGLETGAMSGRELRSLMKVHALFNAKSNATGLNMVESMARIAVWKWSARSVSPAEYEDWIELAELIQKTRYVYKELRDSRDWMDEKDRAVLAQILTFGVLPDCDENCQRRVSGVPCIFTHAEGRVYPLDDYSAVVQCIHHTITDLYRGTGGHAVAKLCRRVLEISRLLVFLGLYSHAEAMLRAMLAQATRAPFALDVEARVLLVDAIITSCYMSTYVSKRDEVRCHFAVTTAREAVAALAAHVSHAGMTDETMALTAAVNYQLGRACSLGAQHNALCGSATAEEVSDMFTEGLRALEDCRSYYESHDHEYRASEAQAAQAELYYCVCSAKFFLQNQIWIHLGFEQTASTSIGLFQQAVNGFARIGQDNSLGMGVALKDMGKTQNFRFRVIGTGEHDGTPTLQRAQGILTAILGEQHPMIANLGRLMRI